MKEYPVAVTPDVICIPSLESAQFIHESTVVDCPRITVTQSKLGVYSKANTAGDAKSIVLLG